MGPGCENKSTRLFVEREAGHIEYARTLEQCRNVPAVSSVRIDHHLVIQRFLVGHFFTICAKFKGREENTQKFKGSENTIQNLVIKSAL